MIWRPATVRAQFTDGTTKIEKVKSVSGLLWAIEKVAWDRRTVRSIRVDLPKENSDHA